MLEFQDHIFGSLSSSACSTLGLIFGPKSLDLLIEDFMLIGGMQEVSQSTGENGIILSTTGWLDIFITLK